MATSTSRAKNGRAGTPSGSAKKITCACTVKKEPAELFQFWRNLENLPRISRHLISVERRSDKESHWKARAPGGRTAEWDAVIINEHENELLAWESLPDAEIRNAGSIRFAPAPAGQGTEVLISMEYVPPAGKIGAALAKLTGEEPELQIADDLTRFKALMETGEIPTTEGQPTGEGKAERKTK